MDYNSQLQQLWEQVAQKKNLEAKLRELQSQHEYLSNHVRELEQIMWKEQADVDRLEGSSLKAVFYHILGKKEELLDKEKMEAYSAKVKYDSGVRELEAVDDDLRSVSEQLREIFGCEQKYEAMLQEKYAAVCASDSDDAKKLLRLEEQMASLKAQQKEVNEATSAGNRAQGTAVGILSKLNDAENWGTMDLFGGGIVCDLVKHSTLDGAQMQIQQLQRDLRRFKTELADVSSIRTDIQVNIDGFLRFADYFFDGIFVDWEVLEQIKNSKSNIQDTINQIKQVLSKLWEINVDIEYNIDELESQKRDLIIHTDL